MTGICVVVGPLTTKGYQLAYTAQIDQQSSLPLVVDELEYVPVVVFVLLVEPVEVVPDVVPSVK